MGVASLSPTDLPRSAALSDLLLAPSGPPLGPETAGIIRDRMVTMLERLAPTAIPAGRTRVDPYFLRTALTCPDRLDDPEPFRWSPVTLRRKLGIAGVRLCVAGQCRTPTAAVHRAWNEMGVGAGAAGGPAPWLADLSNGARAAVISEAVTWATDLWCALDWERFPSPPRLGPPDRWWSSGQHRSVALRARVDVAGWIPPPGGGRASSPVLLTVYAGCPGATSRAELGLATLVAVLSNPKGPVPARSVGYWPECGRVVAVPTERTTLERTIDAVAAALTHRGAPNNHEHRGELMKAA